MPPSRKSRRSGRTKRKSRSSSRRQRQRGGAELVLNCTLDGDNKVQLTAGSTAPEGITLDNSQANILTITSSAPVNNIRFNGREGKPVPISYLGTATGIVIEQTAATILVPTSFTGVRRLVGKQKRLNSTAPVAPNSPITIKNLNTTTLSLSPKDRAFTITVSTA